MTQDFVMGQLRMALMAIVAFAGGKGWLTPTDSGLIIAFATAVGPIFAPWIWSIIANINTKRVPQHALVIDPVVTTANAGNPTVTVQGAAGTTVGKVVGVLAILILGGLFAFTGDARAQAKQPFKPLTGNIVNDLGLATTPASKATATLDNIAAILAKPFQDIANFIGDDADAAVSLSTVIPALQDGHGQQCWIAMKSFGDIIKAHPVPITFHIINDYETLRLLGIATNNLCSNVHCTQVFADATAMAQAASPMPLLIPSLHDLCTKVPQIAVVPPITVPMPAPTPTPN